MFRTAAIVAWIIGVTTPALAEDKTSPLPENTIDCKQFEKMGPEKWIEVGTAVFALGSIKDINLTNQPVTPGFFKFGGIDLFPVVEQKCGANVSSNKAETKEQGPSKSELGASVPKPEEEHGTNSAPAQSPTQALASEAVQLPERKTLDMQSESASCGGRKSIYVADGIGADGVKASTEIAISNDGNNAEFIILESRSDRSSLVYKGKVAKGRFIFASSRSKQERTPMRSLFTSIRSERQNAVVLVPKYIKPHRDGTGSAILYLSGLSELFGPNERGHRFKLEGNPPSETLPEAFYFDRCE